MIVLLNAVVVTCRLQVTQDPRAFLWDARNDAMVLPVSLNAPDSWSTNYEVCGCGREETESRQCSHRTCLQGALLISLNSTGFHIVGGVSHTPSLSYPPQTLSCSCEWGLRIERSFYVDSNLYTVSRRRLSINSLVDMSLAPVGVVDLS